MAWRLTIAGVDWTDKIDGEQGSPTISLGMNGRSTMSFSIKHTVIPDFLAEVIAYAQDGTTKIFGGLIIGRNVSDIASGAINLKAQIECGDYMTYADFAYIDLTYTTAVDMEDVISDIVTGSLSAYGITYSSFPTGVTLDAFTWEGRRVSDALRELSDLSETFVFRVLPTKVLSPFEPGGAIAPYSHTAAAPNCRSIEVSDPDTIPVTRVVLVCGGSGIAPLTQTFTGNGVTTSWVVNVPAALPDPGYVTVGGVYMTVGPGAMYTWNRATKTLTKGTAAIPGVGVSIVLIYNAQYPFEAVADTGGSPVIQHREVLTDVTDPTVAQNLALAKLEQLRYSSKTAHVTTRQIGTGTGWLPGQAVGITFDYPNAFYFVNNVTYTLYDDTWWEVSYDAAQWTHFTNSYIDQWRELTTGTSSGGSSGSSTGGGAGSGGGGGGSGAGTGTPGTLAYWATGSTLGSSLASQSGGQITVAGIVAATTFSGSGASLTALPAAQLTGTITSATQDLITRTGVLVAGATGAGFTLALTTSTITGNLPYARMPSGSGTWTATPTISGATIFSASVAIGTTLGVTGLATFTAAATIGTTLGVSGAATFTTSVSVGTTLGVTGLATFTAAATVGTTLGVTGIATFGTDVTIAGNAGTTTFVSQTTGWRITAAGEADFRGLFSDELVVKSFIADLEQALAGGQIITKSVAMVGIAYVIPALGGSSNLNVKDLPSAPNMPVFVSGDTVVLRAFSRASGGLIVGSAIGVVTGYADQVGGIQTWTFTRNTGVNGGTLPATTTTIPVDAIVLDYGVSGNGYYEVSAIDGTVNVASITRSGTTATVTTSYPHGYLTGDIVVVSGATETAYNGSYTVTVTTTTAFTYTVAGSPTTPATNPTLILLNGANGTNAPYAQIVTWATSPIGANKTLRTRFGNLRGITGINGEYGFIAGTYVTAGQGGQYFRASNTNVELHGVNLSLYDNVSTSVPVIKLDRTFPSFALGTTLPTGFATGVGIWMGKDTVTSPTNVYKFRVGDPAGSNVNWNGTTLTVVGSITATSGLIGGWTIGSVALYLDSGADATSSGMDTRDFPFYAGHQNSTRSTAPFRVSLAGLLSATNANISGVISAASGTVTLDSAGVTIATPTSYFDPYAYKFAAGTIPGSGWGLYAQQPNAVNRYLGVVNTTTGASASAWIDVSATAGAYNCSMSFFASGLTGASAAVIVAQTLTTSGQFVAGDTIRAGTGVYAGNTFYANTNGSGLAVLNAAGSGYLLCIGVDGANRTYIQGNSASLRFVSPAFSAAALGAYAGHLTVIVDGVAGTKKIPYYS